MWVDAQKARELLSDADHITKMDLGVVIRLADALDSGAEFDRQLRWHEGKLHDGRHRLLAIILHGKPVQMYA